MTNSAAVAGRPIILSAPPGCGKSRNAEALRRMFGCSCVVDEWDGQSPVPANALVLTNLPVLGGAGAVPVLFDNGEEVPHE